LDKELARAMPPNLPRATAFGFFLTPMREIVSLGGKLAKRKMNLFSTFLPPLDQFGTSPLETYVATKPDAG
jgi:hypothetical protein